MGWKWVWMGINILQKLDSHIYTYLHTDSNSKEINKIANKMLNTLRKFFLAGNCQKGYIPNRMYK